MPFCDPYQIKIPEGRFRDVTIEDSSVVDRAQSIHDIGQLQPILVTKNMEVVDGATRLLACRRLKRDVWWVDETEGKLLLADPRMRRVAEFQANFSRKDFSPPELAKAIAEVDTIMRELYGSRKAGPGFSEGWSQEDTAKKLGYKSKASVSSALLVAAALDEIPELAEMKTMSEAVKLVKDKAKLEILKELANRQTDSMTSDPDDGNTENPVEFFSNKIVLGDCVEKMRGLSNGICSLWITDPPWKIDADLKVGESGSTVQKAQGTYDDSSKEILPMLEEVIKEMWRVSKPDAWVVMFCGIRHWYWLYEQFRKSGFSVYSKPLVWVRITQDGAVFNSKSAAPTMWPASVTDFMVLAKKGNASLFELNRGDAFLHPIIHPSKRVHHSQKPVGLLVQIISRFYHPSTNPLLIDPFCGSGSTLIAARRLGIKQYFGYERDAEFRERAVAHLVNSWVEEQKAVTDFDLELDLDLDLDKEVDD